MKLILPPDFGRLLLKCETRIGLANQSRPKVASYKVLQRLMTGKPSIV